MFKSILLPVDGSEYSNSATRYAIRAARFFGASVTVLHVIDIKKFATPLLNNVATCLGISSVPDLEETYEKGLKELGAAMLEIASEKLTNADIPHVTRLRSGIVSDLICQEAHGVDLLVMGYRGEASEWGSSIFGSVFEATIRQVNRPVFTVSKHVQDITKILCAYDGSNFASNALEVAAQVAAGNNIPIHVLLSSFSETTEERLGNEVKEYLDSHKLKFVLEKADGDPAESIVVRAKEINADIIIMGAYGHSRIKELLVGSTTEYVLRNAECPVLVYQ